MSSPAHWRQRFDAAAPGGPAWLAALRSKAMDRLEEVGFPTTRLEEWRHTNPARIVKTEWQAAPTGPALERADLERISFPLFACSVFVFVNGRYQPALSSPPAFGGWLGVSSLAADLAAGAPPAGPGVAEPSPGLVNELGAGAFAALNTAFFEDGAHVRIGAGKHVDEPIHLVFVNAPGRAPAASHPRVLIEAGVGSRSVVIEDHVSLAAGTTLTNAVSEIEVGPDAELHWIKVQREAPSAFHVSAAHARVARNARFAAATLSFGTALTRNDARVVLAGEGASCELRGLFVAGGDQHVDNHTWIDHARPHGTSRELYKGILDGHARGVFNGRVVVRPDAQKSDARQQNQNLLLSRDAEIATQPQLEIRADDVKCSHGSTVGQLDPDAMFYLRSRGILERDARNLLMAGFVSEITRTLPVPALAERIEELAVERLGMRASLAEPS